MPVYTVLAPPSPAESVEVDPVDFVFVKDGFCWPCLVIAEIWMIFRRLWLVLLIYIIAAVIVLALRQVIGGPLPALFLLLAHFYFAIEANALRVWTFKRRGYRLVGVAAGRRVGEAEIRFFHELEFPRRDLRQPPPERLRSAAGGGQIRGPSAESGEVVGLFPAPGGSP